MQEQQKSVVETGSKSSKIIDPGASRGDAPSGAKGWATTLISRTILGKRPALAAEGEKQVFSSPNSVLIFPCEQPNDLWTQPKVSSEENASRLPPIRSLFFHHYQSVRTLQKSRLEVAIQVLRAKFEKRVKFSRGFGFLRSLQGFGRSWNISKKDVADRLTTFLLCASNTFSSRIGPRALYIIIISIIYNYFLE